MEFMELMESRDFQTAKHVIENASNASPKSLQNTLLHSTEVPFTARFLSYRRLGMFNLHNVMNISLRIYIYMFI